MKKELYNIEFKLDSKVVKEMESFFSSIKDNLQKVTFFIYITNFVKIW